MRGRLPGFGPTVHAIPSAPAVPASCTELTPPVASRSSRQALSGDRHLSCSSRQDQSWHAHVPEHAHVQTHRARRPGPREKAVSAPDSPGFPSPADVGTRPRSRRARPAPWSVRRVRPPAEGPPQLRRENGNQRARKLHERGGGERMAGARTKVKRNQRHENRNLFKSRCRTGS